MAEFITEDFLLQTKTATFLYNEHLENTPIHRYKVGSP